MGNLLLIGEGGGKWESSEKRNEEKKEKNKFRTYGPGTAEKRKNISLGSVDEELR